jgi:hypothetical protein
MKMALQIAGTTVVDNSRNLVNIPQITFSDDTIQKTKAFKLVGEVVNSSTTSHSFFAGLSFANQIIIAWDCNQFTGPASATMTVSEQTTTVTYTTQSQSTLLSHSTAFGAQIQTSGITNILGNFSAGGVFTRGHVTLTRTRQQTGSVTSRWVAEIAGGTPSSHFKSTTVIGTPTTSAAGFGIGSINLTLPSSDAINIRVYVQE